jgi:hypothetical protein
MTKKVLPSGRSRVVVYFPQYSGSAAFAQQEWIGRCVAVRCAVSSPRVADEESSIPVRAQALFRMEQGEQGAKREALYQGSMIGTHRIGSIFVSGQERIAVTMLSHRARASTPPEAKRSRPKLAHAGLSALLRPSTDAKASLFETRLAERPA